MGSVLGAGALALCAASLACTGEGRDVVLGPRGRGERFELRPAGPGLLVGAAGAGVPQRLTVSVRPLPGRSEPPLGVEVRFRALHGQGRPLQERAFADSAGLAAVGFAAASGEDSTVVRVHVAEDPAAALDLVVLARPAIALAGNPGSVLAVAGASSGVLLRIPAGETYDLVPHVTSGAGGRREYVFRHDSVIDLAVGSGAAAAPPLTPSAGDPSPQRAPLPRRWFGPAPGSGRDLPHFHATFNCALAVHRWAPLVHVGQEIALYVDALEPPDPARLREIARAFDTQIVPRTNALFGSPLDLDGNGRIIAVLSRSMSDPAGAYCHSVHRAGSEVIYALWDPDGPLEAQLRILAHEYQHVIHASQRYRWGHTAATFDVAWLNEGFSLVAEWNAGFPAADLGRTFAFLQRLNGSLPLLGERYETSFLAGWFLFALYLGDRFGEGVYRSLGESGLTGRRNVERVTGVPFPELLRDWFVSLALSEEGSSEPAWSYRSIQLAGEEERAAACDCLPAGRLQGVAFEKLAIEQPFALVRTLDVQDADFFRLTAGERPAALYFQAAGDLDVELFAVRRR